MHDRVWYLSVPKSLLRRRAHGRPVRVHDRDRLRLRICADQPAVRALHVGRRLQRRHVDGDLRLLGAVRRKPPHDARHRGHQVPARTASRQPADRAEMGRQMVLARPSRAWPGRHDDGLHAAEEGDVLEGSLGDLLHRGRRLAVPGSRPLWPESAEIRRRRDRRGRAYFASELGDLLPIHAMPRRFHTWMPDKEHLDWLSEKYPNTFDKYYRPRWEMWAQMEKEGKRFYNMALPQLCQTCQIPMAYTEPGDPTTICFREIAVQGRHAITSARTAARTSSTTSRRNTSRPGCRCTRSSRAIAAARPCRTC